MELLSMRFNMFRMQLPLKCCYMHFLLKPTRTGNSARYELLCRSLSRQLLEKLKFVYKMYGRMSDMQYWFKLQHLWWKSRMVFDRDGLSFWGQLSKLVYYLYLYTIFHKKLWNKYLKLIPIFLILMFAYK